jgi:hypothetical protein
MSSDEYVAPSPHVGSADASRRSEEEDEFPRARAALFEPQYDEDKTGIGFWMRWMFAREVLECAKLAEEMGAPHVAEALRDRLTHNQPRGLSAAEEPCSERVTNIAPYETYDPKGEGK